MTTTISENDPLFRAADQMPLGRGLGLIEAEDTTPSSAGTRPFGLGFATSTAATVTVDLSHLRYDTDRQLSVDDAGIAVFSKHSTGQTNTKTSDGHKSMDSDTDHTED